jgi:hypothetical protein
MNLGENRIGKRILRLARSLTVPAFRIPKPFLIEFITASRYSGVPVRTPVPVTGSRIIAATSPPLSSIVASSPSTSL